MRAGLRVDRIIDAMDRSRSRSFLPSAGTSPLFDYSEQRLRLLPLTRLVQPVVTGGGRG